MEYTVEVKVFKGTENKVLTIAPQLDNPFLSYKPPFYFILKVIS